MAKSKDVVFDSERLERQQRLKRTLLPAAALVGILIVAAVLALLLRGGRRGAAAGGEDAGYPYTWVQNKNGSVTLEIDRSAAPGYQWTAPSPDPCMNISVRQDDAAGKTSFTLTPAAQGRSVLVFSLCRPEDGADVIGELNVLAENREQKKSLSANLLGVSLRRLPGVMRGGEDTLYPYRIRMDEDGDMEILVTDGREPPEDGKEAGDSEEPDEDRAGWKCVSDNEGTALPLGVIEGEGAVAAYVRPGDTPGVARVRVFEAARGVELVLELQLEENGYFGLLTHTLRFGAED